MQSLQLKETMGPKGKTPCWRAIFCIFLQKIVFLMPFGLHVSHFQSHFKEQNF